MSKKKKKKRSNYSFWRETQPHEINKIANDFWGSKYYCVGDDVECKKSNAQNEDVQGLPGNHVT